MATQPDTRGSSLAEMRQVAAERAEQIRRATRWTWGHRTVLGPVAAGCADLAAGITIDTAHASTASVGLGALSGALLAHKAAARWCTERLSRWVSGSIGAAGAWLTASTVAPPTSLPMIGALAGATTVCAAGLSRAAGHGAGTGSKQRRAEYTKQWAELAGREIKLPGSRVMKEYHDRYGATLVIEMPAGQDGAEAITTAARRRIESSFGLRRGSVSGETVNEGTRLARLRILTVDPHAQPLLWTGRRMTSVADPVPIGTYADGTDMPLRLYDDKGGRHMIIGGASRSGKSSLINQLLCELVGVPDAFVIGADLKDGQELGPWRGALPLVVENPADTLEVLLALNRVLEARAKTCGARKWKPAPGWPAIVLVVDETAELWATPGSVLAAESIARRGLSLGVHLVLATQYPTWAATGSRTIRSQSVLRACFKMNEARQSSVILQELRGLVDGVHLPADGGYLYFESPEAARPIRGRAVYVEDHTIDQVIAEAKQAGPPDLDAASAAVLATLLNRSRPNDTTDRPAGSPTPPARPTPTVLVDGPPALPDEPPPLPAALAGVSLSALTGVEPITPVPDTEERVAADKEQALQMMRDAGPEGVRLRDVLRATGRPASTMHDWLDVWRTAGAVAKVSKGRYRAVSAVPPAEATGT